MHGKDKNIQTSLSFEASPQTPVMRQYYKIKGEHKDKIVLFRLGDFYEIFGADAQLAAEILQLQLTSRSKDKKTGLPMCGFPAHSLENYLYKLVAAGHKVALCDQVEEASVAKGLIAREIVQIVTPGTIHSEKLIKGDQINYIAAIDFNFNGGKKTLGLCFCDISTGNVLGKSYSWVNDKYSFIDKILMLKPSEILLPQITEKSAKNWQLEVLQAIAISYDAKYLLEYCDASYFATQDVEDVIEEQYSKTNSSGINDFQVKTALVAIIKYIKSTQFSPVINLSTPTDLQRSERMQLDDATLKSLNVFKTSENEAIDLYSLLNKTSTAAGARALRSLLNAPFVERANIEYRLDALSQLNAQAHLRTELKATLKQIGDLERVCGRLSLPNFTLMQLQQLKLSIECLPQIELSLSKLQGQYWKDAHSQFDCHPNIEQLLHHSLNDSDFEAGTAGCIAGGYDAKLDQLRALSANSKQELLKIEQNEVKKTGISNLAVQYNKIHGYFFELSRLAAKNLPSHFNLRQTLVNNARYTTLELQELEIKLAGLAQEIEEKEKELLQGIIKKLNSDVPLLRKTALLLADIDLVCSLSVASEQFNYCRPSFSTDQKQQIDINGGRHPIVEQLLPNSFISNNTKLNQNEAQVMIITGPNMGGKSTYMRQVALISYMAQLGCFVPAAAATVSIFDRIFTRIGASDNMLKGMSTFIVEMSEAAHIINQSTSKSLVVIDELGRGTSTYDGISLAWAILEQLLEIGAITLFSTHYHELIKISEERPLVKNFHVEVLDKEQKLLFNHKLLNGPALKSYGIQVAGLSGMPKPVIARSWQVYHQLTAGQLSQFSIVAGNLLPPQPETVVDEKAAELLKQIVEIDLNNITPLECLKLISEIQQKLDMP